jgi:hypothetical protein
VWFFNGLAEVPIFSGTSKAPLPPHQK